MPLTDDYDVIEGSEEDELLCLLKHEARQSSIDGDPTCAACIGLYHLAVFDTDARPHIKSGVATARSHQHPSLKALRAAPKLPEQASEDRGCSTAGGGCSTDNGSAVVALEN